MATLSLPRTRKTGIAKADDLYEKAIIEKGKKIKFAQEWLKETYPAFRICLPLDTGIHIQTLFDCPKGISKTTLKHTRRLWCGSERYLKALAAEGSMRHKLDGSVAGPVSDEHRATAKHELAKRLRDAFKK